jgi:hypothetical protein
MHEINNKNVYISGNKKAKDLLENRGTGSRIILNGS